MDEVYIQGQFNDDGSFYYVNDSISGNISFGKDQEFITTTLDLDREPSPIAFADDTYHIKQMHFHPNGSIKAMEFYTTDEL